MFLSLVQIFVISKPAKSKYSFIFSLHNDDVKAFEKINERLLLILFDTVNSLLPSTKFTSYIMSIVFTTKLHYNVYNLASFIVKMIILNR